MTDAAFSNFARVVKGETDVGLSAFFDSFDASTRESRLLSEVGPVLRGLRSLTERGGKRLRGVLLAAAYEACGGTERSAISAALVSFELLQTYLLVHDDWMDRDDVRRGGPTLHAALTAAGFEDADAFAVLAGDLAAALSLEALASCRVPEARIAAAARVMGKLQRDVVLGQMLDVRAAAQRGVADLRAAIDEIYTLKTASYTVTGPFAIGAVLAGAPQARVDALVAASRPLGVMFQLRDDVLGVFGDEGVTGKSASNDLRHGKFTALIVEAADDPVVLRMVGDLARAHAARTPLADEETLVGDLRARIVAAGARERLEARMRALHAEAERLLRAAGLTASGTDLLIDAANVIGGREK